MAKALLLNALHDALSDYVVGLSPERLKVGVWSGKIVLDELQVRETRNMHRWLVCLKDDGKPIFGLFSCHILHPPRTARNSLPIE